jgi:parallel beta-helix repeat protein
MKTPASFVLLCISVCLISTIAFAQTRPAPVAASQPAASALPPPQAYVFNVLDFGAKGDGITLNTQAITSTISAAAKAGGGTVVFPPGVYVTGTIELRSSITLQVQSGAVIEGSKNLADYGSIASFGLGRVYGTNSSGEGNKVGMIFGRNVENVSIIGPGIIDGNGDTFFDPAKAHASLDFDPSVTRQGQRSLDVLHMIGDGPIEQKREGRPGTMIICFDCKSVLIRDVTLRNAPNWTAHFNRVEGAVVSGLHVINNPLIPNNDGFDCFSCKDVHFSDCDIRTGDDDFAIVNSRDVTVANCTLSSRSSGIRLEASEYNMFENLTIHSNRGIAIFERGFGRTSHISFANIRIETQLLTGHWWGKGEPIYIAIGKPQAGPGSGEISNLTFSNVSGEAESSIVLYGYPDAWLHNIVFDDVHFTLRTTRKDVSELVGGNFDFRWTAPSLKEAVFKHDIPGIYGRYVDGLHIQNSSIHWCLSELCGQELLAAKDAKNGREDRKEKSTGRAPDFFSSAIELEDFRNLDVNGFRGGQAPGSFAAAISLSDGQGVSIRNSTADEGTRVFLEAHGVSGARLLMDNDLSNARAILKGNVAGFRLEGNYHPVRRRIGAKAH